jgi:hypothetical protein
MVTVRIENERPREAKDPPPSARAQAQEQPSLWDQDGEERRS